MKKKLIFYYFIMFLPLAVTLVAWFFLPDKIPAHYGFDNEVTRWGSKNEAFIYPITTVLFGFFMLFMAKISSKQEEKPNQNNYKIVITAGLAILIYFNIMSYYALYLDFKKITNLSVTKIDIYRFIFSIFGVILIIIGNIMPKAKMNSIVGFRTKWSMKNEEIWKRCQHFAGISIVIGGIFITAGSCFIFRGSMVLFWSLGVVVVMTMTAAVYSYHTSKA